MMSNAGSEVYERQEIADAFADFYSDLYRDADRVNSVHASETQTRVEDFTWEEVETAIKMLRNKKAPDNARVCAEMIKYCGDILKHVLLATFNSIIEPNMPTPEK